MVIKVNFNSLFVVLTILNNPQIVFCSIAYTSLRILYIWHFAITHSFIVIID